MRPFAQFAQRIAKGRGCLGAAPGQGVGDLLGVGVGVVGVSGSWRGRWPRCECSRGCRG